MGCRRYRIMLHLNRPGELSARDAEKLTQHLETCPECSAEFKLIRTAEHLVDRLRSRAPLLEHPDAMLEAVLAGIRHSAAVRRSHQEFPGRLIDFFLSPAVRFGTAGLSAAAIVLFMVQEVTLMSSVHSLEGKIASRISVSTSPEVAYSVSAATTQRNPDLMHLKQLIMPRSFVQEDGGIVVARRIVEQFVDGVQPGSAVALGRDPRRIASLLAYVRRNSTIVFMFDNRGR